MKVSRVEYFAVFPVKLTLKGRYYFNSHSNASYECVMLLALLVELGKLIASFQELHT